MDWRDALRLRIREELKRQGKTQRWLAEKTGYSRTTVTNTLNDKYCPRADFVVCAAIALGVSADYLFGFKEERT